MSCNLGGTVGTFGFDLFDLLQQSMVLAVHLHVSHLLEGNLLQTLTKEVETLRALFAN
jgi:hypothetical protein